MKWFLLGLLLASLTGCVTLPTGFAPWGARPPVAVLGEPSTPPSAVAPEEITAQNCREKVRQLDAEIRHDEQQH